MSQDFHFHKATEESSISPTFMSVDEIKSYKPYSLLNDGMSPIQRAKKRMIDNGVWEEHQIMGLSRVLGCVAVEITQRCNLDCTLCYLSENSESVKDIPIEEIYRRIDVAFQHYGPETDIQVTGGDPTLRQRDELLAIVRKIKSYGMRPTLMTNGIKASRELLMDLKAAGLEDVAFHVDITQERKGFKTEVDLNKLRKDYIERVRGVGLSVLFNTTVHKENFHEVPDVIRFFRQHADVVNFASFQLQADTGRGVKRERDTIITADTVSEQIRLGAGENLRFDVPLVGHKDCNKYATSLVVNGNAYDAFYDKEYIRKMGVVIQGVQQDRQNQIRFAWNVVKTVVKDGRNILPSLKYAGILLWRMKADLIKAKGLVRKQSFFIHNFMGAHQLEKCRIDTCSFMVMTSDGPVSMCLHNAKRDDYILKPFKVEKEAKYWNPMTGQLQTSDDFLKDEKALRAHQLKGTLKQKVMSQQAPGLSTANNGDT